MKFITDHYFEIGNSHQVCQDYAMSGVCENGIPYAIVCDGCSSSDGNVDFGARIMAHALFGLLSTLDKQKYRVQDVIPMLVHDLRNIIRSHIHSLFLTLDDFLATIESVFLYDGWVYRIKFGDGVHMIDSDYTSFEFTSNAPFYLAYTLLDENTKAYINQFGAYPVNEVNQNGHMLFNGGAQEYIDDNAWGCYHMLQSNQKFFAVASDGLKSFSLCEVSCDLPWVIDEVSRIKNTNEGYMQRRMKTFLKKTGLAHYDDVAVASILIDREDNKI